MPGFRAAGAVSQVAARLAAATLAAATLAAALTGCAGPAGGTAASPGTPGGGSPAATTSSASPAGPTTPAAVGPTAVADVCGPPDARGRVLTIHAADGVRLAAITVGTGRRGVLLIPELGGAGMCGWWDYAAFLAHAGYRVLAFDHRCSGTSACPAGAAGSDLMADIRGAAGWLRGAGAVSIVLVGASQGASEALIAASRPSPGITGVVALSADELTARLASPPYPASALTAAPRLNLPAFFAVAGGDPYVSVTATRRLVAAVGSASKRLVVAKAGAGHGWGLVQSAPGGGRPALSRLIVAFLARASAS